MIKRKPQSHVTSLSIKVSSSNVLIIRTHNYNDCVYVQGFLERIFSCLHSLW